MQKEHLKFFKNFIQKILNKFGYTIKKYDSTHFLNSYNFSYALDQFLKYYKINLVLNIGAHDGKFYRSLLKSNYNNKILSFEPGKKNFNKLKNSNKENINHKLINIGFGNNDCKKKLYITRPEGDTNTLSSVSNFFCKINPLPKPTYEIVDIKNPYTYFKKYINLKKNILIKIDASGYDFIILKKITKLLPKIMGIIVDASLNKKENFYTIDTDIKKFTKFMEKNNFDLFQINSDQINPSNGKLLRAELFFVRNSKH